MTDVVLRPTPREIASGLVLGQVADPAAGPSVTRPVNRAQTPLAALEAAVLPALRRPPCLVSFSGGLDSSLVLAVAVRVARREGLPDPVPVTWRFADAPRANESSWQERVIQALGIESWQILHADDDLDLVGPVALRMKPRYGPTYPMNLHLHLPIVDLAAGGALLTGAGGDQVLQGRNRAATAWHRPLRRMASRARSALVSRRPAADRFPWLHSEISRQLQQEMREESQSEPRRLGDRIVWHTARRELAMTCSGLELIAADHAVTLINPLLDERFLTTLAAHAGHRLDVSRDNLLAQINRGELPAVITAPRAKANFIEVFLRSPTREFISAWDGTGADESLVDVAALQGLWSTWPIPPLTSALVQHLWLASNPVDSNVASEMHS